MNANGKIRVAVNGYGVIGKRVADAVACQDDLVLAGVADVGAEWRIRVVGHKGDALYARIKFGASCDRWRATARESR